MRILFTSILSAILLPVMADTLVHGTVTDVAGIPVAGAAISDGHEVVLTDLAGQYSMRSPLDFGYVFVSTPDGYEPAERLGNRPKFWQHVAQGETSPVDFRLRRLPSDSALAVIAVADLQIANRAGDRERLRDLYVPDLNRAVDSLRSCGLNPILLTLGDQTCEYYWYDNNYGLSDFNREFTVNAPVYHTMGNHDNDPYFAGDIPAATTWHREMGPSYYSFNRGGCHFVVLDNILYNNADGAPGHHGKRDYRTGMTSSQLAWLERDLATVRDKDAPLFISMHGVLLSYPVAEGDTVKTVYRMTDGGSRIDSLLAPFRRVNVLSGHAHNSHFQHTPDGRIREYNYQAACGTWWPARIKPPRPNFWMGGDGAPWGYAIWNFSTPEPTQLYKGFAMSPDYQMRVYDLNCVSITDTTLTKAYLPGDESNRNVVLANVWAYEPGCSVRMFEDGRELKVTRVKAQDPLHFMLRAIPLKADGVAVNKALMPENTAHMFRAHASRPDTPVMVEFTDIHGHTFTTVLSRPARNSCLETFLAK